MSVVPLVEAPVLIHWGCAKCRTIHKRGFGITVTIDGMRSLVGDPQKFHCCGEDRTTPLIFATGDEARLNGIEFSARIPAEGNCDFLNLIPYDAR